MDEELVFLILFVGFMVWLVTYLVMKSMNKARMSGQKAPDKSVGLGELEERIERAVESANEPLRREIRQLRRDLEEVQVRGKKLDGGAIRFSHANPFEGKASIRPERLLIRSATCSDASFALLRLLPAPRRCGSRWVSPPSQASRPKKTVDRTEVGPPLIERSSFAPLGLPVRLLPKVGLCCGQARDRHAER